MNIEFRVFVVCCIFLAFISCNNDEEKDEVRQIDLSEWELFWSDEFDYSDSELDDIWNSQNGANSHILSSRWRENVLVSNGTLKLLNKKESRGGKDWTSGCIWTKNLFLYGYFECRYKYAAASGTNNSFWLMPEDAKDFEIDINEGHYSSIVNTNVHHRSYTDNSGSYPTYSESFTYEYFDFSSEYHLFGLEWSENEMVFYLDRIEIRRVKNNFCFNPTPIWLSLAVIEWAGSVTDGINGTQMEVDYVRVYKSKKTLKDL